MKAMNVWMGLFLATSGVAGALPEQKTSAAEVVREVKGWLDLEELYVPAGETVWVTGDVTIRTQGELRIDGRLRVRPGTSSAGSLDAADITLVSESRLVIAGQVLGAHGLRAFDGPATVKNCTRQGGAGTDLFLEAPLIQVDGIGVAGNGGVSGPNTKAPRGGDVEVRGTAVTHTIAQHTACDGTSLLSGLYGGRGGKHSGASVTHKLPPGTGGDGGSVFVSPRGMALAYETQVTMTSSLLVSPLSQQKQGLGSSVSAGTGITGKDGTNGIGGPGTEGATGAPGSVNHPNGQHGRQGGAGGSVSGTNGQRGGDGQDRCPDGSGGAGGVGGAGGSALAGSGGKGGHGGDAYLDPSVMAYIGKGGDGGDGGPGGNAVGGNGGHGGKGGRPNGPGGAGGSAGAADYGGSGDPGIGGAGSPYGDNGVIGLDGKTGHVRNGRLGPVGWFCER